MKRLLALALFSATVWAQTPTPTPVAHRHAHRATRHRAHPAGHPRHRRHSA